jgi:hypothetical protein
MVFDLLATGWIKNGGNLNLLGFLVRRTKIGRHACFTHRSVYGVLVGGFGIILIE